MTRLVAGSGPKNARIMVVGDAPGIEDERTLTPFNGLSGQELTKMLNEVGIVRTATYLTNVCQSRPPGGEVDDLMHTLKKAPPPAFVPCNGIYVHPELAQGVEKLWQDIAEIQPSLIIALGNTALWALTNGECTSVAEWRGSQLLVADGIKLVPTYHPSTILRQWSWRVIAVADLRRAVAWMESDAPPPAWRFLTRPSFDAVMYTLQDLTLRAACGPLKLAVDIETRDGHITCIGLGWSVLDAICIPFWLKDGTEYWDEEEEFQIIRALSVLLTHPNVQNVGQNFSYDAQYIFRHWRFMPHLTDDTMVMQHVAFAGMQKGLDFLGSLYCTFYRYWKQDRLKDGDDAHWTYNCTDCVVTFEVAESLRNVVSQLSLDDQYSFQMEFWWDIMLMMLRGAGVNAAARSALARELLEFNMELERRLTHIVGHPINVKSPKQLQEFFYGELRLPPIKDRKTGRVSTNFEAIQKLGAKEPLVLPIAHILLTQRSIGVFVSTFLQSQLDVDGRMRCSFNVAGPETYRLSSSQNPFGSGMNLQNIPSGDRKKLAIKMPNVRKTFIPDPGKTIFDIDLDRADLQVVVWEADDADLKRQLRLGVDLHVMNGVLLAGKEPPPEDELIESHPNYPEHKARYKIERQLAKNFVHGTNYGGKEKTMAAVCGITVADCARLQKRWFDLHPGIKRWHDRVERALQTRRFVTNAFGYRRYYFDRVDGILPEALAWVPQSTVANVTARMQHNIERQGFGVDLLIQVHDSLVGQYDTFREREILPQLHKACLITIPYPDPLIIPVGLKTSTKSWGDCEGMSWPEDVVLIG